MSRRLAGAVFALIFAGSAGSGLLAIRNKPQASDAPKKSPEAAATEALNSGLKRLEKADQIEPKNPKQARKEYEAALKDFQAAAESAPDNYRAHNGAGYSLRKLGNYERALASYERALALAPTSSEAIEYRAEAYLGLNRLDDAKQAYMHLFVHDRIGVERADEGDEGMGRETSRPTRGRRTRRDRRVRRVGSRARHARLVCRQSRPQLTGLEVTREGMAGPRGPHSRWRRCMAVRRAVRLRPGSGRSLAV